MPRQWIVDVHYLAEGFEGLLVASTLDRKTGLVQLTVAPGEEEAAREVVEHILLSHQGIRLAQRTPAEG